MSSKKKFIVEENETINDCLARMEREGYLPVRRIEKPVFKEEKRKGKIEYKPISQKIIFEGIKSDLNPNINKQVLYIVRLLFDIETPDC